MVGLKKNSKLSKTDIENSGVEVVTPETKVITQTVEIDSSGVEVVTPEVKSVVPKNKKNNSKKIDNSVNKQIGDNVSGDSSVVSSVVDSLVDVSVVDSSVDVSGVSVVDSSVVDSLVDSSVDVSGVSVVDSSVVNSSVDVSGVSVDVSVIDSSVDVSGVSVVESTDTSNIKKKKPRTKKVVDITTDNMSNVQKKKTKKNSVNKSESTLENSDINKDEISIIMPTNTEEIDKSRSFKIKLPNDEDFSGRFTGLTPYQAANKALSKYFRTSENNNITDDQVIFSIKESTRGSKRQEYTYKGSRIKLEQPITYTIKSIDGVDRVITKQYKNQLIKVKKGNNITESVTTTV